MTDLKNQQTLFRLISLREPELSKEQDQDLRFVLFTANSGPFYTAVLNRPSGTTKWEALEQAASSFAAFTDLDDVQSLSEDFYPIADWVSRNRYDASDSEIEQKITGLTALNATDENCS